MSQHQWYYRTDCTQDDAKVGPFNEREFLQQIEAGSIAPDVFVLSPTRSKHVWYRLKQVPALMRVRERGLTQREEIIEAEPVSEVFEAELVEPTMEQALQAITSKMPQTPVAEAQASPQPDLVIPEQFSEAIAHLARSINAPTLSINQRTVYALTARSLNRYRRSSFGGAFLLVIILGLTILAGFVGGLVALSVVYGPVRLVFGYCPNLLLYLGCIAIITGSVWIRLRRHSNTVELSQVKKRTDHFRLGRLHRVLRWERTTVVGASIGALFGAQTAALFYSSNHLGLSFDGNFVSCLMISLDNVCHGIFLDSFELWKLSVSDVDYHHTFVSATMFLIFRIMFDVFFVLVFFHYVQRSRMSQLFDRFPADRLLDPTALVNWIGSITKDDETRWHDRFTDEIIFLGIVRAYIQGDFELVRQLSHQFPQVEVDDSIREMFVDSGGNVIFESAE